MTTDSLWDLVKDSPLDPAQALIAYQHNKHHDINETIARFDSPVQKFFENAVVFITGGSGFLGKQLIEKLFRSCKIKKVYILLRPKKQRAIQERFNKMLEDGVFDYLKKTQPDFVDKIELVKGDVSEPRLGISDEQRQSITEEVTVIFHGAATIQFTDPIKRATMINVFGTREMILLARDCKKLRSFVHISTAYTHATASTIGKEILEQFYESPVDPHQLIEMVQGTDDVILETMTPQIIKGWENTYSFTKAAAEELVRNMAGDLPVCVVRPAIVICALREPEPGWIDKTTAFGPSGLVIGSGLGVLHILYAHPMCALDLVPVDLVNNAVIAAAHETAQKERNSDVMIYTVTGTRKPVLYGEMVDYISTDGRKFSSMKTVWYGWAHIQPNKFLLYILHFLVHAIPGYLLDGILLLIGKKPILTHVYNKIQKLTNVLGFYSKNTFLFGDSNLRQLYSNLSPADRTIYNFDMDSIDWKLFIILWCIGCRKFVVKDGLKDTRKANQRHTVLKYLHYTVSTVYISLIFYIVYKVFTLLF